MASLNERDQPEIFSLELVARVICVHGEILEIAFPQFVHFLVDFVRLLFPAVQDLIDILVRDVALFRGKDVVRTMTNHGQNLEAKQILH